MAGEYILMKNTRQTVNSDGYITREYSSGLVEVIRLASDGTALVRRPGDGAVVQLHDLDEFFEGSLDDCYYSEYCAFAGREEAERAAREHEHRTFPIAQPPS